MINSLRENKILSAVFLLGLFSALVLCGIRARMELRNTEVCVIMSENDLALIQGEIKGVIPYDGGGSLNGVWLLPEDEEQYGYRQIGETEIPDPAAAGNGEAFVRCFYLYPQFAERFIYLGSDSGEEIGNILYRAVTDRNIRVIWLTPFVGKGEVVTDAETYNKILDNLSLRLASHGLTLGRNFSVFPSYEPNPALFIGSAFGVVAAGLLLMHAFLRKLPKWLLPLGLAACPLLYFLLPDLVIPLFALAASVIFPCLALWYAVGRLSSMRGPTPARGPGAYLGTLFIAFGISIAGGLFVGALQSGTGYLLAVWNFRGVKVSQILPVCFAAYAVLRWLCPPGEILGGRRFIVLLAAAALLLGASYYILRTGNANVSAFELQFRSALEQLLIARPRTKEFLIAWPSFAIAAALVMNGRRVYSWPFAVMTSAGFASVVNTFCHSRAPLWLSLARSALGALIGASLGCLLILVLLRRKRT